MKKTFSTLAAFCLGIVISITVVACADDINDIVTGKCDCSEKWEEVKGKLLSMDDDINGVKAKFTNRDIARISYYDYYEDGELGGNIKLEYDNKGRISKCVWGYPNGEVYTDTFVYETGKCKIYTEGKLCWVIELSDPKSENFEFINVYISQKMAYFSAV